MARPRKDNKPPGQRTSQPLSACYSQPNAFSARPRFCAGPQPTFSAWPAWRQARRQLAFHPACRGYSAWPVVSRRAAPDIRPRQLLEENDLISSVTVYHCFSESVQGILVKSLPNVRSEEHTSELQSLRHLVCRLLL